MIPRKTPLARSGRIKPRNPARRTKQFARAYHSAERVQFVQGLHCIVMGCPPQPSENAHIKGGGAGRKAAYTEIVPLCHQHHAELHSIGAESFQRRYVVDFREHADGTEQLWQQVAA